MSSGAARSRHPDADCGLRNPDDPHHVIRYRDVTPEELFQVARLVVAAEIAKIHTIEWTTQLLYDEPLYRGMNGNWNGVFDKNSLASHELADVVTRLKASNRTLESNQFSPSSRPAPAFSAWAARTRNGAWTATTIFVPM